MHVCVCVRAREGGAQEQCGAVVRRCSVGGRAHPALRLLFSEDPSQQRTLCARVGGRASGGWRCVQQQQQKQQHLTSVFVAKR